MWNRTVQRSNVLLLQTNWCKKSFGLDDVGNYGWQSECIFHEQNDWPIKNLKFRRKRQKKNPITRGLFDNVTSNERSSTITSDTRMIQYVQKNGELEHTSRCHHSICQKDWGQPNPWSTLIDTAPAGVWKQSYMLSQYLQACLISQPAMDLSALPPDKRSVILTAMSVKVTFSWYVAPCNLVDG